MASPTHRDNILSKNYKDIGIAVKTGVLLGKETTLVVQMFGNLTTDVQGSNPPPTTRTPVTRSPVIETGQIKAISITQPKAGDILKDPTVLIKGEVQGDKDEYSVQLFDLENELGEVEGKGEKWEFSSEDEWVDGSHNIEAKVKGTNVVSESVEFVVDTTPPTIARESIEVLRENSTFTLSFNTDEEWNEITIVNGDEEISFSSSDTEEIILENFDPSDQVVLSMSDQAGNTTELDITEYFIEGETEEYNNFNFAFLINSLKSSQGINVIVVTFILILLIVEVYILWKKGKLGKSLADLFVIALWITILTIGIFKGFGGVAA
jgi:hypothetical protein